jgi:hypothetical protein
MQLTAVYVEKAKQATKEKYTNEKRASWHTCVCNNPTQISLTTICGKYYLIMDSYTATTEYQGILNNQVSTNMSVR